VLRLVLPKGSLEKATLQLFEDADLAVVRSSDVDYRAGIDDPRVIDVTILRPQEIPHYVAGGLFDLGVTGRDWVEETGVDVVTLTQLHYSKATARPFRIVLAVALLTLVLKVRLYSLKLQDRIIRLEERLRLTQLLSEPLRSRIPELTEGQLCGLRFASDAEVPKLAERALNEKLTRKDIKQAIQNWRPDYWRV
jgi:ATP phosphoribosyltransferase